MKENAAALALKAGTSATAESDLTTSSQINSSSDNKNLVSENTGNKK